jgi:Holliday junction resolvasome RuvABC DNA-binding subunit
VKLRPSFQHLLTVDGIGPILGLTIISRSRNDE